MVISAAQLEKRKKHIGSSDMSAIVGLDPFRSSYDVWLEKTGRLVPETGTKKHLMRGNYMETAILNWFEDITDQPITRNQYRSAKADGLPFGANIDAIVNTTGSPVEAKSQGAYANEIWGEEGTDELPDRVIIQSFHHMICTDTEFCHVPVHLPFREFCLFHVEYKKDVASMIIEAGLKFWEEHVIKDTPPLKVAPRLDMVKRIRRVPNKIVEISPGLIGELKAAKEVLKHAKKDADKAQALLLAALDGAEEGYTPEGSRVTNFLQQRKGYTTEDTEFAVIRFPKK